MTKEDARILGFLLSLAAVTSPSLWGAVVYLFYVGFIVKD